ncbi:MAG: triacylglycerol lipase [Erysipelothrix sp.]
MSSIYLYKDRIRRIILAFLQVLFIMAPLFIANYTSGFELSFIFFSALVMFLLVFAVYPHQNFIRKHLTLLYKGNESLKIFVISLILVVPSYICYILLIEPDFTTILLSILWVFVLESLIFWNGMIRVYISSVQLGLKTRVLAIVYGWIPIFNIWYLTKIISMVTEELDFESQKDYLGDNDVYSQECATKYPILLVHGIFFRDIKYLNYWGRVPRYLEQRGAKIYYGEQESSQSVEVCGKQLAQRIKNIVDSTGCEKVNIIAHSKGGLDARYAISNFGIENYVASLSTINTPHNGCIFANYLLGKAPRRTVNHISKMYNNTFKLMGDDNPDFLAGVTDLTDESCKHLNKMMENSETVFYQSFASYTTSSRSGKFPLNITYPIVKHFDGRNDGLVSVESASFFNTNTIVAPVGNRGITHADIIDLNKENIPGFDVRKFYSDILNDLKRRGF